MKNTINNIVGFIKDYVASAHSRGVVLGMSGGKDSLIVAKLCTLALGKENVFGLVMPNGHMTDKQIAEDHCGLLGIEYSVVDIKASYDDVVKQTERVVGESNVTEVSLVNIAPRLRMTYLYSVAGSKNSLVANTSNLSEIMIGYSTKWGDGVGDFAPIADLTKTEVCELGTALGLPQKYVLKRPDDGLSGKTDEEKLGFSYDEVDAFIRKGEKGENFEKISRLYQINTHKRSHLPKYQTGLKNYFE